MQKYKEEIFVQLAEIYKTAIGIGITEDELVARIKEGGAYD